jgi:hypothetical protein
MQGTGDSADDADDDDHVYDRKNDRCGYGREAQFDEQADYMPKREFDTTDDDILGVSRGICRQ